MSNDSLQPMALFVIMSIGFFVLMTLALMYEKYMSSF